MNSVSQIGAKLLPFALIASLFAVFHLLGVFSVQAVIVPTPLGAEALVAKSKAKLDRPVVPQAPSLPATSVEAPVEMVTNPSDTSIEAASEVPPSPPAFVPGTNTPMQPPREGVTNPAMPHPQYIPPAQPGQTPLAGSMNANGEPVQLPSNEIGDEDVQMTEEQAQQIEGQVENPVAEPQTTNQR